MRIDKKALEFDWDKGNLGKNKKHGVEDKGTEEVFLTDRKLITEDEKHSILERRYLLWGETKKGRKLAVIFTYRDHKVRIISARDMNRKERKSYEEKV